MHLLNIKTRQRNEFLEITEQVQNHLNSIGIQNGACMVYSPHTTAGMTIQENADPDVVHDILLWLEAQIPQNYAGFRHAEKNSDSHIKASLMGSSVMIPITDGKLSLGTWQGVYFCEFDGPRRRQVYVQVWNESTQDVG